MTERKSNIAPSAEQASRTFVLAQQIRYGYSSPVTELYQRLMTVPPEKHGAQRRRSWKLNVNGVDEPDTRTSIDTFSNVMVEAMIPHVANSVEFVVEVEVEVEASIQPHHIAVDRRFLSPTPLTKADATIRELAFGATANDIASLCATVNDALDYEWGITGVGTTASEALARKRGVCQDYAHIMLAACRHAGIPARYVSGHLPGEGASHAWVEVLHPILGQSEVMWTVQGWDPTHNRQVNSNYLVIAVGRDYSDVAPLSGTYNGKGVTSTLTVDKQLMHA